MCFQGSHTTTPLLGRSGVSLLQKLPLQCRGERALAWDKGHGHGSQSWERVSGFVQHLDPAAAPACGNGYGRGGVGGRRGRKEGTKERKE